MGCEVGSNDPSCRLPYSTQQAQADESHGERPRQATGDEAPSILDEPPPWLSHFLKEGHLVAAFTGGMGVTALATLCPEATVASPVVTPVPAIAACGSALLAIGMGWGYTMTNAAAPGRSMDWSRILQYTSAPLAAGLMAHPGARLGEATATTAVRWMQYAGVPLQNRFAMAATLNVARLSVNTTVGASVGVTSGSLAAAGFGKGGKPMNRFSHTFLNRDNWIANGIAGAGGAIIGLAAQALRNTWLNSASQTTAVQDLRRLPRGPHLESEKTMYLPPSEIVEATPTGGNRISSTPSSLTPGGSASRDYWKTNPRAQPEWLELERRASSVDQKALKPWHQDVYDNQQEIVLVKGHAFDEPSQAPPAHVDEAARPASSQPKKD